MEYNSNATQSNLFVDIETALGFTPTAATITQIEFRGDFGFTSETITLTFSDNDAYVIGNPGSDSASYTQYQVAHFLEKISVVYCKHKVARSDLLRHMILPHK